MAKPTQSIFPIENGKLSTNLDCNNLQLINLDESNLSGGGGGGGGNDTGTTIAILKGDGNHGFADAIPGTDYATAESVSGKEDSTAHDADIVILQTDINSLNGQVAVLNAAVPLKADSATVTAALALKTDLTTFNAYVASNDADVALKAYTTDVDAALGFKADTSLVTTGLAGKEPLLPASPADGYILSRDLDQSWHFVDPISLGGGGGGGGGTGTVTSVGVNQSGWTDLFSSSVSNATSSPVINIVQSTTVGANRFYGNFAAFTGAAGFGTAAVARTSLGGTTIGQALFQLANPSTVGYIRTNADNSVTTRTTAETKSDLGAESALTFSSPLARSINAISIPQATNLVSGYLTSTDWATFNAKVSTGVTLTTTTPLTIDGVASANLTQNRTLAMPAATTLVSGYLTSTDWNAFTAKPPNTRAITTTAPLTIGGVSGGTSDLSANRTIAIPKATASADGYLAKEDFATFNSGGAHTIRTAAQVSGTFTIPTASPPYTRVIIDNQLTGQLIMVLPPASLYNSVIGFPFLEIVDIAQGGAQANFKITLRRSGGDLLDNSISDQDLSRGLSYLRLNSDGSTRWITTKYFVDSFVDPTTPTKRVTVDVSKQTAGTPGVLTLAAGASVTVGPTLVGSTGVVTAIDSAGIVTKSQLSPTNLLPLEYTIGTAGAAISTTSSTVDDFGTIDTVRIAGTLTSAYTIVWPSAANYNSGETVVLLDASGSASPLTPVTITPADPNDTFNGQSSFVFDEANGRKVLTSDHANGWAVSLTKNSLQAFHSITPVNGTFNVVTDASSGKQNARLSLGNGQNNLTISGPVSGMAYEFVVIQPSSGAAGTLSLPIGSLTPNGVLGTVTLSSANSAIDRLRCSYDAGIGLKFFFDAPILDHASANFPTAPSALVLSGVTASKVDLAWTDNSANESGFRIERALGAAAFAEIATVGANVVTYTDNGVASGTTYRYRVRAYNSAGYSGYLTIQSTTTVAGGPTADLFEVHFNENLGTLAATTVPSGGSMTLNYADWTAVTHSGAGAAFNPSLGMLATANTQVAVNGATGGTATYKYQVAAFKQSTGLHNANVIVSTGATAQATLSLGNFNRVTWNAVTGADYYVVYRSVVSGSTHPVGSLSGSGVGFTSLTFDDTGVATNGTVPGTIGTTNDVHNAISTAAIDTVTASVQKLSVAFWIKSAFSTTVLTNLVSTNLGASSWQIQYAATTLRVTFPGATGVESGSVLLSAIGLNAWHHVVVEMDNSTSAHQAGLINVYVDGSPTPLTVTAITTTKAGAKTFPNATVNVGGANSAFAIDDLRVYGRLLTTAEIAALFVGESQ